MVMEFRLGLENFLSDPGKGKFAIVTNTTGVDTNIVLNVDLMLSGGIKPEFILAPEHGFYGSYRNGEHVPDESYEGIPVKSLYGEKKRSVTREDLEGIDNLIFDIQDCGARPFTYISTLHNLLKKVKETSVTVTVLDRPNPIGADIVDGPMMEPDFISFVGTDHFPLRYGMTIGELSNFLNRNVKADLKVVKMTGYNRKGHYGSYLGNYIAPSMNLNSMSSLYNFPGFVLLEACNMSVGRGTPYPFVQIGYDGIWSANLENNPGIKLRKVMFSPWIEPMKDRMIEGLFTHITDVEKYNSIFLAIRVMKHLYSSDPKNIDLKHLHLLYGSKQIDEILEGSIGFSEIKEQWEEMSKDFLEERKQYLLY